MSSVWQCLPTPLQVAINREVAYQTAIASTSPLRFTTLGAVPLLAAMGYTSAAAFGAVLEHVVEHELAKAEEAAEAKARREVGAGRAFHEALKRVDRQAVATKVATRLAKSATDVSRLVASGMTTRWVASWWVARQEVK